MELEEIKAGLTDYGGLYSKVIALKPDSKYEDYKKQYQPLLHDVADNVKRPDKTIQVPDPEAPEGSTATVTTLVKVTRIPISMQKLIVSRAAAFLCGNPIQMEANPVADIEKSILAMIQKTWDDNKLDFDSKKIAKLMMAETEVAELWYTEEVGPEHWQGTVNEGSKFALRMKILANSLGDKLHPIYSNTGDMIAFGREYKTYDANKNEIVHFDVYTADTFYFGTKKSDSWDFEQKPNVVKKIPIIYYQQDQPEWMDVENMIERLELVVSNHGDTNDYNGSPTTLVKGKIVGFSKKGETGKVLEVEPGADVEMLSWDSAPESIKMEVDNLRSFIFDMTDTPDISFNKMANLGGNLTNFGVKMMFLGAHMKAADKEEIFGKGIQRRINYLKAAIARVNIKLEPGLTLTIKPKFEYYLPKDSSGKIDMLVNAVQGGIMSQATAIKQNPLIDDWEAETDLIKAGALDAANNGGI